MEVVCGQWLAVALEARREASYRRGALKAASSGAKQLAPAAKAKSAKPAAALAEENIEMAMSRKTMKERSNRKRSNVEKTSQYIVMAAAIFSQRLAGNGNLG